MDRAHPIITTSNQHADELGALGADAIDWSGAGMFVRQRTDLPGRRQDGGGIRRASQQRGGIRDDAARASAIQIQVLEHRPAGTQCELDTSGYEVCQNGAGVPDLALLRRLCLYRADMGTTNTLGRSAIPTIRRTGQYPGAISRQQDHRIVDESRHQ